jgi:hypothetical protein
MKFGNRFVIAALASVAILGVSTAASATALIQGVVFFGAGTPTTEYSKAGSQVAFSFVVPDPLDGNPTTDVTDFSYQLNGVTVAGPVESVAFFPVGEQGMFDIDFSNDVVSIYGADIGSTGIVGPAGYYSVTAALNQGPATGAGGVTVSAIGGVPEPATWAMMLIGFGGLGGVMRSKHRKFAEQRKFAATLSA